MKDDIKRGLDEAYRMLFPYRTEEPINEMTTTSVCPYCKEATIFIDGRCSKCNNPKEEKNEEYEPEYNPEDDPEFIAKKEKEAEEARAEDIALAAAEERYMEKKHGIDEKIVASPFEEELEGYELHLHSDPMKMDKEGNETDYEYTITSADDPSVGIYAYQVAPYFKTVEELQNWWNINKDQLLDLWDKEDWAGMDKLAGIKEELEESFGLPTAEDDKKIGTAIESLLYDLGEEANQQISKEQFNKVIEDLINKFPILTRNAAKYAIQSYLYTNKIPIINEGIKNFNKEKAWGVFEQFAVGNFNEVADYNYTNLEDFYRSSIEFVPMSKWGKYKAALQTSQTNESGTQSIQSRGQAQDFTSGPVGKLREAEAYFNFDDTEDYAYSDMDYGIPRKPKIKPAKFKLGDTVRIIRPGRSSQSKFDLGKTGKIIKVYHPTIMQYNKHWAYILDIPGSYGGVWEDEVTLDNIEESGPVVASDVGKIPLKRNVPQGELRPSGIGEE